jgi:hypothetical protein
VPFPSELQFHACHVIDGCCYPNETHDHIKAAAWKSMTILKKVWWMARKEAVCDSSLDLGV